MDTFTKWYGSEAEVLRVWNSRINKFESVPDLAEQVTLMYVQ